MKDMNQPIFLIGNYCMKALKYAFLDGQNWFLGGLERNPTLIELVIDTVSRKSWYVDVV